MQVMHNLMPALVAAPGPWFFDLGPSTVARVSDPGAPWPALRELLPADLVAAARAAAWCSELRAIFQLRAAKLLHELQLFPGAAARPGGRAAAGRRPGARAAAGRRPGAGARAAAWWPTWWPTWWPVPVFVFVFTRCPVFVIRWPRSHTLGPRALGRVAWAVGRVARFAGRAARGRVPE